MKTNKLLILALAVSAALAVSGCKRDEADEADHAAVVAPAATPAAAPEAAPMATTAAPMTEPAAANPAAPMMDSGMSFADMDKNHDGGVTADELHDSEMLSQHFKQADTNGDGKLSEDEIAKHRADMAAKPGG